MNMLRNIKSLIAAILLAAATTSCLDKVPESSIPEGEAMQTFNDAEQILTGIYSGLMSSSLFSGTLTIMPDIQADLAYAVENFSNVYGPAWLWNLLSTDQDVEAVYAGLYAIISRCNFFLERIDAVKQQETDYENIDMLDTYTGEVHTIRALCYSKLIECFCKAYDPDTAENELGVVLRSKYSEPEPMKRASLKASYEFVLDDLARAEELLDNDNDQNNSIYITAAAAQALHARVALYMQDYQTAIDYASKVIDNDCFELANVNVSTSDESYLGYLWSYDVSPEIIWVIGFTTTSYGGALGQVFLNFNRDYYYMYPDYVPATWVLNAYADTDLRYDTYFQESATGYANGLTWPLLIKYAGNQNFISSAKIYMVSMPKPFRLAEQYLIRAEAYCSLPNNPNFSAASKDLTTLRQTRYSGGAGAITVSANNWLETISQERVRELYMEGFRLNDLKRWHMGFERTPQSCSLTEGSSLKIEADDPRFVWPIPRHELESPGAEIAPNESNN